MRASGLVLTTGNKSELSLGYCTLYGDTVGGLAVLGDVYKNQVYALARHANRQGERIPTRTIEKPPSAELAPGQLEAGPLAATMLACCEPRFLVESGVVG